MERPCHNCQGRDKFVSKRAALVLCHSFIHIKDNEQAWKDIITFTKDVDEYVRGSAAEALGSSFELINNKKLIVEAFLALINDEANYVRGSAALHIVLHLSTQILRSR